MSAHGPLDQQRKQRDVHRMAPLRDKTPCIFFMLHMAKGDEPRRPIQTIAMVGSYLGKGNRQQLLRRRREHTIALLLGRFAALGGNREATNAG